MMSRRMSIRALATVVAAVAFTGCLAPDQADPLTGFQGKAGVIQQGHMAKSQLSIEQCEQSHDEERIRSKDRPYATPAQDAGQRAQPQALRPKPHNDKIFSSCLAHNSKTVL